ncbi:Flp family type IVb pilin [Abyssibacter profundi]|uniref:Flp family type IVb pilin n=1 Tax=Abyssibacter profundi TaxID=2182787 RepID=A0A363UQB1_9GAMM|nr:Flp family type IVb pilin [Abyssibacter profundi]MBV59978.1 Flp family type IVb pilin [Nevskiales bacterium]PWN57651.1 Flp family type IVb pilin [Abyssibacter profundi]
MLSYVLTLYKLWRDDEAASAVEYGLVIGLIAVALIVILGSLGEGLEALFKEACDEVVDGGCSSGS